VLLELYKRKTFIKRQPRGSPEQTTFFDNESDANYGAANPGTVTIEGFGLECWQFNVSSGRRIIGSVRVREYPNPKITIAGLLRRLDELRRESRRLGQDPVQDELDLIDLVGDMGYVIPLRVQVGSNGTCLQASIWEGIYWPLTGLVD
jgi:hypothetical protein